MKCFEVICRQAKETDNLRILVDAIDEHTAMKALKDPDWQIIFMRELKDEGINLKSRFLSWEKLRIVYNSIMLIAGIPVLAHIYWIYDNFPKEHLHIVLPRIFHDDFNILVLVILSLFFGVIANCAYSLGPFVECYWIIFAKRTFSKRTRYCLFTIILLLSLLAMHIINLPYVQFHFQRGHLHMY